MLTRLKKKFIPFLIAIFFVASAGFLIADQSKVVMVGGGQAYKPLDDFLLEGEVIGGVAGNSWYVDSGKSASGDGKSWDYAVITLNEAIDLATASNGDVIHVAPGHAETIDAATDVIADVIGITVIGYGEGAQRPTFTWADSTDATIPVSAADFKLYNMIFDGASTASDTCDDMFYVTAAGFQLIGCKIITGDSTEAATLCITGISGADRMKVIGCQFTGSTDTGTTAAIYFNHAADDIEIAYNTFNGDYGSAAIYSPSAVTQVNIHHNYVYNFNDDDHAIELSSNTATGTIAYNQLVTDAYATALDSGGCDVFETYWANDEVDDVMAVQVFTHEDGATPWSATELVALAGATTTALEADYLDELIVAGVATNISASVHVNSLLGNIMSISNSSTSTYTRTTDSLEAIGTQVADTNLAAQATSALEADYLDELVIVGTAVNLSASVHLDSIIGNIMSASNNTISTYDRTTDSLEALGTQVADTNLAAQATSALEADYLDELIITAMAVNLSASVHVDSILGEILSISNASVSTYNRTTDSLEAIGADVDTIIAATLATVISASVRNALEADYLDELASANMAVNLSASVALDSIIGEILSVSNASVSTYNRATDSLEAIATALALGTGATTALENDYLDELIIAGMATNLSASVHVDSILGNIMSVSNSSVSTYDRTTDSLEAIGTDVVAIEVDTTAIEVDTQDIQQMVERCATRTADILPASTTETIFDVSTGPVRVLEVVGRVVSKLEARTTLLKVSADPTIGSAVDLCGTLDVTGDVSGTFYVLSANMASALTESTNGVVTGTELTFVVPVGAITITTGTSNLSGSVQWYIRYQPLAPGATVAANGP